jgi:hypothetical protein
LENFGQLGLFLNGTHFEVFEVDGFKVRQIEEYLTQDEVDELLILVVLSNDNSVV